MSEPTEAEIEAAAEALGVHRWKDMGIDWCSCECGEILRADEATAVLESFPADEVFRLHLAGAALRAAQHRSKP